MSERVLITGVSSFLGASLAKVLSDAGASAGITYVAGVDLEPPKIDMGRAEFIRADIRSPLIARVITATAVDTVVHADLTSRPGKAGGRSAQKEWNVIGTMQLLGACQRTESISKVVVRSSTAAYGYDPGEPSILREDWISRSQPNHGYSKDIFDAEQFARDFGRRRPDVKLTILRLANVIGPTAETNMTQFFSLPFVPTALGFDPRLQLLHEEDAIEVLRRAVVQDHPGVFNVAADGVVYLSQAIRIARRLPVPIVAQLANIVGDVLRRTGSIDFSSDQVGLILHGRVVDTTRLRSTFGYKPRYSTMDALKEFVESRASSSKGAFGDWEKELYALITRLGETPASRPHAVEGSGKA
ncbi:MAG: NAD-dependent epimerase/dehydratase family protein [Actinomycetota bacterium]|nr:NAD-dependent epimerase/dehydratase family protein [Actinomycetota bacterium]